MKIAIISHPECLLHQANEGHPERPERVRVIQEALQQFPFQHSVQYYESPKASREQLIAAHEPEYVDSIFAIAPKEGLLSLDPDTYMNPFTLDAALRAAGAVPFAVDLVMTNKAGAAFCNIRPPGHHAEPDQAMGFCFFNNVAIGVNYARQKYQLNRIAIVDFDVHHGNGTQAIFQNDKDVLYCSSFEHPFYPGYDPDRDNEHILSVPLRAGTTGDVFRELVQVAWFDKIAHFKPQLIFFSAGFDAHVNDPIGELALTADDYVWLTEQIVRIAKTQCGGKVISALEGGYNLQALAECVPLHVNALAL